MVLMGMIRKMVEGFAAWNRKPRGRTPEQVAQLLRSALGGRATHEEMDYFISVDISDPTLNEIKEEVGSLYGPGWEDDVTREKLRQLLLRVEARHPGIERPLSSHCGHPPSARVNGCRIKSGMTVLGRDWTH